MAKKRTKKQKRKAAQRLVGKNQELVIKPVDEKQTNFKQLIVKDLLKTVIVSIFLLGVLLAFYVVNR